MYSYYEEPIIFTNGVFDLLHYGHIKFLEACKSMGGYVVVGINSDSSVRRLKGPHRPIIPEQERKEMLLSLEYVDEVMVFVEDTPADILEALQPEIYVKSEEYEGKDIEEFRIVASYGGKIGIIRPTKRMKKYSTTTIIDTIFAEEYERRLKTQNKLKERF